MLASIIGFVAVFALLFLGAPIAFGMGLVGFAGFAYFTNWHAALAMLGQISYETTISDELSVLPLFILMGSFINRAGLGQELYDCANAFLGHRRGGLAMATVAACGESSPSGASSPCWRWSSRSSAAPCSSPAATHSPNLPRRRSRG